jgi:hypothetical protein
MQPESSLPHLQEPATCPYSEPDQPSPCSHPTSCRSILILLSHLEVIIIIIIIIRLAVVVLVVVVSTAAAAPYLLL